jgi:hypothetical protein
MNKIKMIRGGKWKSEQEEFNSFIEEYEDLLEELYCVYISNRNISKEEFYNFAFEETQLR